MKRCLHRIFFAFTIAVIALFSTDSFAANCASNQVEVDGTCYNGKFALKTIPTNVFEFSISASGTFTVDCGAGGTLESDLDDIVNSNTLNRANNTSDTNYACRWSETAIHTVIFDGIATGYSSYTTHHTPAIQLCFGPYGGADVKTVYGSLGAIFPTLNNGSNDLTKQPRFTDTFSYCSEITSLPSGLFNGIDGAANDMFMETFEGCTGLTSLPAGLFNGIDGAATNMFRQTFWGCTGLTSLPAGLFNGIDGAANNMFNGTFAACTGLTSLRSDLFNGIDGAATSMFESTFEGCTGLTSLPSGLFNGVDGAANSMFKTTFWGCTGLTSLPSGLFSGVDETAQLLFDATFMDCTGLTSVPTNLFANISGTPASYMFDSTFSGCSNLTGFTDGTTTTSYIPPTFFGSISSTPADSSFMYNVFYDTGIATSCPANTYQYTTGFESYWNYTNATNSPGQKVSCEVCPNNGISAAGATSVEQCSINNEQSNIAERFRVDFSTNDASGLILASGAYAKGAHNANVTNINDAIGYMENSSVATINSAKVSADNVSLSVNGFTPSGTVNVNSSGAIVSGTFNVPTTVPLMDEWGETTTTNATLGGIQQINITNGGISGLSATFTGTASGDLSGTGSFSNASVHVDTWRPINPQQ